MEMWYQRFELYEVLVVGLKGFFVNSVSLEILDFGCQEGSRFGDGEVSFGFGCSCNIYIYHLLEDKMSTQGFIR